MWVGQQEVGVTSRESDVFFFLAHRAGQVLSKRRSIDGVWSDDFEGDSKIVEVYIARLRRKLAEYSSFATVDTIRSAGYRLDGARYGVGSAQSYHRRGNSGGAGRADAHRVCPGRREPIDVDVDDVVIGEVALLRPSGRAVVDTSGVSGAQVLGGATQLDRAARHLLDNAARHGGGSKVAITRSEESGQAELSVTDDGAGIPVQLQEQVFERFARVDEARAAIQGFNGQGFNCRGTNGPESVAPVAAGSVSRSPAS